MYYIYEKTSGKYIRLSVSDRCLNDECSTSMPIPDHNVDYYDIFFQDNIWNIVKKEIDIESLKTSKITKLKKEGSRRIQTINGKYYDNIAWLRKSQNYQDTIARLLPKRYYSLITNEEDNLLKEAENVINRKDIYVKHINNIEDQIMSMESIDEIEAIDVMSDEIWDVLDE